jgi:hypothetical protein
MRSVHSLKPLVLPFVLFLLNAGQSGILSVQYPTEREKMPMPEPVTSPCTGTSGPMLRY